MKKIELSEEAQLILFSILFVAALAGVELGYPAYLKNKEEKANMKIKYNSIEVLNYNADTIEMVFHNYRVKNEFNQQWRAYNYNQSIRVNPVGENMRVLKYNGDTIRIKFDNARFQRQFEKQWRKYSDHKLNHQNIKKR